MYTPDLSYPDLTHRIYDINEKDYEGVAMQVWKYQYTFNPVYKHYCQLLGIGVDDVQSTHDIPFLPIATFKNHIVKTGDWASERVFQSSGTTGSIRSQHHVRDLNWYHQIALGGFKKLFRAPEELIWLGLLPSYLDRPDSSLVDMVNTFMSAGGHKESSFFPKVGPEVLFQLTELSIQNAPVVLIGVTFALLDLFEKYHVPVWENLLVMETGGMKGRGVELTRDELYERLRTNHPTLKVSSEYGMTELLSQAYRMEDRFVPGPQMKVMIRDISDPLSHAGYHQRGAINIIDLANLDTCAFIATDDIGIQNPDGTFDVIGRLDNSDLRGCNLLYA